LRTKRHPSRPLLKITIKKGEVKIQEAMEKTEKASRVVANGEIKPGTKFGVWNTVPAQGTSTITEKTQMYGKRDSRRSAEKG